MTPRTFLTRSEAETFEAGRALARTLRPGDVVLLVGDLGMGKTVFARGLATGLGVPPGEVRSPTFTLVNQYRGRLPVYHVDLYRVDSSADLEELGLEEILGTDGVAVVEWAERLGPYRVEPCVEVTIRDRGGRRRRLRIQDGRPRPTPDRAT
ncbi:MAG: tRNA (adenosine(37)-N6)-threonylcarbamoyltransferase complex ATPase subunit type 1 TsaE [Acidobacteriota bacterium]